jgi:hypothetical protein
VRGDVTGTVLLLTLGTGIGSALFNSCRQIGTAMGLAILGSVAASVILAEWHRRAGSLPPAGRQAASRLAADVAGGQAHLVAASAGQDLLNPALKGRVSIAHRPSTTSSR